jgi:glycosyltransferase involved in cell wall biosynthesis
VLTIALDYRPALFQAFGIGRYVRNLVPALLEADPSLRLALYTIFWRRRRQTLASHRWPDPERARAVTLPVPARAVTAAGCLFPNCARWLLPDFELFHDTDYVVTPVRGRPRVVTLYDTAYLSEHGFVSAAQSRRMERAVARLLRGADRVITISEFARGEILRTWRFPEDRVTVAPLGVDPIFLADAPGESEAVLETLGITRPFVLYIGTLEPRKNLVRLVRAFICLHRIAPEHELILVGRPGHCHERVLEEIRRQDARGSIRWLGTLGDREARGLLRACAAFAYPSLYEGFGLPALEGMAAGAPVLASDSSALREVCGDGALLVDPTEEGAIFEGLRTLCLDRSEAIEIAERGRARAREFTWEACARGTLAAYRAALGGGG